MENVLNLNWSAWLYGLGSGFIGGGASAVTSGVVVSAMDKSGQFVLGGKESIELMLTCFVVNGVFSAFFYLKQHPLPDRTELDENRKAAEKAAAQQT